ncbi:MAG TPA: DNA polymerase/3'-5' exonuclease PolX [Vicinamibacterales bacterium]|nr:DNA polymerase/3'-5' exonuclease PolX [Vicinamibacterales bacterium]
MDNPAIAHILQEIADLLEIKADNPFKIRAYRSAADIVGNHPHDLATLSAPELREIPGIGKDLAARIREIAETGDADYHRELIAEFPPTILDLLHLQGVGPKTVAFLYRELDVRTLDDLERAALDGRVRALRGMGPKKEALILKALEERKRHAGRHLLPDAHDAAAALVSLLRERAPTADIEPVGSLRRGCESCGDIDILASGADVSLIEAFTDYRLVERILGQGDTKASVLLQGGFQADLRLVAAESRGAAMQYFTGSKAHNIALRDRAIGLGFKLNEYGLFRTADDACVAGATEEEIYEALGLQWIPAELREARGEIDAAAARSLPRLVARADLRGDLHMHSTESDGRDDVRTMAEAARAAGLQYIAITDHSKSLAMANGLDEQRVLDHASRIRALDADGSAGVRLLAGVECDIKPDGTMDLADECLAALDVVVASVHSAFNQDRQEMTDRLLRAIEHPHVDIVGHPTGRRILKREPYPFDVEAVVDAAARHGVALEINCQVDRLDLNDVHAGLARERGVPVVISSDAHSRQAFGALRWGAIVAQRAWLTPEDVLNTRSFDALTAALRRNRRRA